MVELSRMKVYTLKGSPQSKGMIYKTIHYTAVLVNSYLYWFLDLSNVFKFSPSKKSSVNF